MRRWSLIGTAIMVTGTLAVTPLGTTTETGASVSVGPELITRPGQLTALTSGGSATAYGVSLPAGASCPGDSAHQGYHVFSYLVPVGVSPTVVSFKTGVPSRYFGYIADGSYFGAVNTAQQTGQILGLPPRFTWSRLTPQDLFTTGSTSAVWEGGIACADTHGTVTSYWNSAVRFSVSSSDPGGFTWTVMHNPTPPVSTASRTPLWGIGLLGLAAVSAAVFVLSRRSRRRPSLDPASSGAPDAPGHLLVDVRGD